MTTVTTKNAGDLITETDYNAILNKIQNGTDTDTKISSTITTGSSMTIVSSSTSPAITIDQNGEAEGAIYIENTGNIRKALLIYTNNGATQAQPLVQFTNDNAACDQPALRIQNDCTDINAPAINLINGGGSNGISMDYATAITVDYVGGIYIKNSAASLTGLLRGGYVFQENHASSTLPGFYYYNNQANAAKGIDIQHTSATNTAASINVSNAGTGQGAIILCSNTAATDGLKVYRDSNTISSLLRANADAVGTNYFYRNLAAASTAGPVVGIYQTNAGDDQPALQIVNAGTGVCMALLPSNTGANTFYGTRDSDAEVFSLLQARADGTGTFKFLRNLGGGADTSGPVVNIIQDHASDDQPALSIQNDGTGATIYFVASCYTTGGAALVPTWTNFPGGAATKNPTGWLKVSLGGTAGWIPMFT